MNTNDLPLISFPGVRARHQSISSIVSPLLGLYSGKQQGSRCYFDVPIFKERAMLRALATP
jgi:hypothetical protein